jgi:membrane protein implicated in regulation of membrane protease activity
LLFLTIGVVGLVALAASALFDDVLDSVFGLDVPFLSGHAIAAAIAIFGFVAYLTDSAGWGTTATVGTSVVVGVLVGGLLGQLVRVLRRDDTDETPSSSTIVGAQGYVTAAIAPGQYGQVALTLFGHPMRYSAMADQPIPAGAPVEVAASLSSTSVRVVPVAD